VIPSIDDPSSGDEYDGGPDDDAPVLDGDPPRTYPIRILNHHEVVNDGLDASANPNIDERPVAVTWCPIYGSGVAYDRVVDG